MDTLTLEQLERLSRPQGTKCISIYMPAVEKSQEVRQNPIRFKNLLDQAQDVLRQAGMDQPDITELFRPARALLEDKIFWQHQEKGLAVFIAKDFFWYYNAPVSFEELAVVSDTFYLKPLLPLANTDEEDLYILALSQNEVRLFHSTPQQIEQVSVPNLPKNFEETMNDLASQWSMQYHTGTAKPVTGPGPDAGQTNIFGHGPGEVDRKNNLLRFFHKIDDAVAGYLKENKAPLIVAGVEYLLPIYREANTYKNLADEGITGNQDGVKPDRLREEAWKLIKTRTQVTKENAADQYRMLSGEKNPRAVKDLTEIIKAAPFGRVSMLFVDKNAKRWGAFDAENLDVRFDEGSKPDNEDLLDYAAIQTLLNGGMVFVVDPQEVPDEGTPAVAIFRY